MSYELSIPEFSGILPTFKGNSSSFPRYDVNPGTGEAGGMATTGVVAENTVYMDSHRPSQVLLPFDCS